MRMDAFPTAASHYVTYLDSPPPRRRVRSGGTVKTLGARKLLDSIDSSKNQNQFKAPELKTLQSDTDVTVAVIGVTVVTTEHIIIQVIAAVGKCVWFRVFLDHGSGSYLKSYTEVLVNKGGDAAVRGRTIYQRGPGAGDEEGNAAWTCFQCLQPAVRQPVKMDVPPCVCVSV
ncbi:hypothetical protein JOB18_046219, partial [Solea senegalensis]